MGHVIFCVLHLLAILFGFVGLFFTVPLHIIYTAVSGSKGSQPTWKPQKDCPYCKMKVDRSASKCPYCQEWIPQQEEGSLEEDGSFDVETENRRLIDESMSKIESKFPGVMRVDPSPYQFYALVYHSKGTDIIKLGGFNIKTIPKDKLKKMPNLKEWMEKPESDT